MNMLHIVMVLVGLTVVAWVLNEVWYPFDKRCPYSKECNIYDINSNTCNKTAGQYYGSGYCGRYRDYKR